MMSLWSNEKGAWRMSMVVYAEASAGSNPGHMVVGEELTEGTASYFGFRFDPAHLPPEYRQPEHWRKYLFNHAIPGMIVDETAYVTHLLRIGARVYYEKRVDCDILIESRLPPRTGWVPHAWYSFNPDDQYPGREPCYNCVKWAIMIANSIVAAFLPLIPQGRLKGVLEHLRQRPG
jgi:hypothetical protein